MKKGNIWGILTENDKEEPGVKYERLKFFKNENGERIGIMVDDKADHEEIEEKMKTAKTPFSIDQEEIKNQIEEAQKKYKNHVQKILTTFDLEKDHLEELDIENQDEDEMKPCQSCNKLFKKMFEMKCKNDKHKLCGKCVNSNIEESFKGCQFDGEMIYAIKELNDFQKK